MKNKKANGSHKLLECSSVMLDRNFAIYSVEPTYSSFVVAYKGPTGTQDEKGERDKGGSNGGVLKMLSRQAGERTSQRGPCRVAG